jgi:phage gp36-like protein
MNPVAIQTLDDATVDAALTSASLTADGYMRGRFSLPLTAWDMGIREKVAYIAGYNLMSQRGMNPGAGADVNFRMRYEDAIRWFEGVQRQAVHPLVTETLVPVPRYEFPQIASGQPRGWTRGH